MDENNKNLYNIAIEELRTSESLKLFRSLNVHPILEAGWVGNDAKACRMFVDWVIFLFNEIWKEKVSRMEDTLMIVDGHVAKVFCRSRLLEEVFYEKIVHTSSKRVK